MDKDKILDLMTVTRSEEFFGVKIGVEFRAVYGYIREHNPKEKENEPQVDEEKEIKESLLKQLIELFKE